MKIGSVVWAMILLALLGFLIGALGVPWYASAVPALPLAFYVGLWGIEVFFRYIATPFVDWVCGRT